MSITNFSTKEEVVDYINTLQDYEGYVQFSHRKIDLNKDVFINKNPKVENEDGFIYEAHFCNGSDSISIKQLNNSWIASKTNIENAEINTFIAIDKLKVNMAQVWEKEQDELCENMEVLKLKKVVFAGFKKESK